MAVLAALCAGLAAWWLMPGSAAFVRLRASEACADRYQRLS